MSGDDADDARGAQRRRDEADADRDAILKRRQRLVAIALSGLTTTAAACYESHVPSDARVDSGRDSGIVTPPEPCLGAPFPEDAGLDAGPIVPMPCLSKMMEPDAGLDGATPKPCLDWAPDDSGA